MLMATPLGGSIMDLVQAANADAQAAASSTTSSATSVPPPGSTGLITDILDVARENAAAQKRKATWLLVAVGAGGLVLGVLVGRYAIPKRTR